MNALHGPLSVIGSTLPVDEVFATNYKGAHGSTQPFVDAKGDRLAVLYEA